MVLLRGGVCNIWVCTFGCSAPDFLKNVALCEVPEAWPAYRPGQNSMNMEKLTEQGCCNTKRGKANDLEEACLSTHLSTTKSLREKKF
jgi:hypothetical protein